MMPDRQKLIEELEWNAIGRSRKSGDKYVVTLERRFVNSIIDLLKEQEAVKPEKEHSGSGITWWNVCGNCKTAINPNDKYCHECGCPVLWEGR